MRAVPNSLPVAQHRERDDSTPGRIQRRRWNEAPKREAQIAYLERDQKAVARTIEYLRAEVGALAAKGLNTERKEKALTHCEARLARTTAQLESLRAAS